MESRYYLHVFLMFAYTPLGHMYRISRLEKEKWRPCCMYCCQADTGSGQLGRGALSLPGSRVMMQYSRLLKGAKGCRGDRKSGKRRTDLARARAPKLGLMLPPCQQLTHSCFLSLLQCASSFTEILAVCLFVVVLHPSNIATSKVISGWIPTCYSAH